jgi:hypothetical protein
MPPAIWRVRTGGAWTERWRALIKFHSNDHAPDSGKLSAAEVSLFRRIATLKIQLEQIEATMAGPGSGDVTLTLAYATLANGLRRPAQGQGGDAAADRYIWPKTFRQLL